MWLLCLLTICELELPINTSADCVFCPLDGERLDNTFLPLHPKSLIDRLARMHHVLQPQPLCIEGRRPCIYKRVIEDTSEHTSAEWCNHRNPEVISSSTPHFMSVTQGIAHQTWSKVTSQIDYGLSALLVGMHSFNTYSHSRSQHQSMHRCRRSGRISPEETSCLRLETLHCSCRP